jgi:hypothetical protein
MDEQQKHIISLKYIVQNRPLEFIKRLPQQNRFISDNDKEQHHLAEYTVDRLFGEGFGGSLSRQDYLKYPNSLEKAIQAALSTHIEWLVTSHVIAQCELGEDRDYRHRLPGFTG